MIKKILALLLSVMLTFTLFTACTDDEDSSSESSSSSSEADSDSSDDEDTDEEEETTEIVEASLTIDGEEIDTTDLVMFTIGDNYEVTFDEFRYNYYYFMSQYGSSYGVTEDDMADLTEEEQDEKFTVFKNYLVQFIMSTYTYLQYADDNGIELTEDELQECEDEIADLQEEQGDDYEDYLKSTYLTEDYLRKLVNQSQIADKVRSSFELTDDEFIEIAKTDLYQVKTLLVPYGYDLTPSDEDLEEMGVDDFDSLTNSVKMTLLVSTYTDLSDDEQEEQSEKALEHITNLVDRANDGEDFDDLIEEYGFDGGMTTYSGGYVVRDFYTSYGDTFVDTLFDLDIDEISEPYEFTYGYMALKRVEIDEDYIRDNLENDTDDDDSFKEEYEDEYEYKTLQEVMDTMSIEETDILTNLSYGDLT
ncbi:MAG: peptidylprolyl isomerase [Ruminococcus sp.]|nr:peptidylprolyl isomerase [Ruminococcus sp.]